MRGYGLFGSRGIALKWGRGVRGAYEDEGVLTVEEFKLRVRVESGDLFLRGLRCMSG